MDYFRCKRWYWGKRGRPSNPKQLRCSQQIGSHSSKRNLMCCYIENNRHGPLGKTPSEAEWTRRQWPKSVSEKKGLSLKTTKV